MEFEKKGAMQYVIIGGARYQIAPEENGGLLVRLVEDAKGLSSEIVIRCDSANTVHIRPE